MSELHELKCIPCTGNTPTLSEATILGYMKNISGWILDGKVIRKNFTFKDFKEALIFFNRVAQVAELEDHHPDMCITKWKNVTLSFTTHAANGLTENDFIMAAKVDSL